MKILTALLSFLFAGLSLVATGLIVLAAMAQRSLSGGKPYSIAMGPWTLSGWQIYATAGLFALLTLAFVWGGFYLLSSSKKAD